MPVGGKANNQSTINMGTDSAAGPIERITNSIDSIFDLEWYKRGCPADIDNLRKAAQNWVALPEGKLRNIKDASAKEHSRIGKENYYYT